MLTNEDVTVESQVQNVHSFSQEIWQQKVRYFQEAAENSLNIAQDAVAKFKNLEQICSETRKTNEILKRRLAFYLKQDELRASYAATSVQTAVSASQIRNAGSIAQRDVSESVRAMESQVLSRVSKITEKVDQLEALVRDKAVALQ